MTVTRTKCPTCGGDAAEYTRVRNDVLANLLLAEVEVERLREALGYGSWEAQATAYRIEVERLREGLAFYAESKNWAAQNPPGSGAPCWHDHGQRAKAALDG